MPYFLIKLRKKYANGKLTVIVKFYINKNYVTCFTFRKKCSPKNQQEVLKNTDYFGLIAAKIPVFRKFKKSHFKQVEKNFRYVKYLIPSNISMKNYHVSCRRKNHFKNTRSSKLETVIENDNSKKFWLDNSCAVCLESYAEVLKSNRHLVKLECKHALCCRCADRISVSSKPECPQCRSEMNPRKMERIDLSNVDQQQIYW